MRLHIVNAGNYYYNWKHHSALLSLILKAMKKYKIQNVMVSTIDMWRIKLITKEKMEDFCKGKLGERNKTICDDLEQFFHDIQVCAEPICDFYEYTNKRKNIYLSFFVPKLTKEELQLVEKQDEDFMDTFHLNMEADVDKDELAASESQSKYVFGESMRMTFTIKNALKRKFSSTSS